MKVLFLDIDGVLNCRSTKARCQGFRGVDKTKVKLLKQIIDSTGAEIVLSSTWRLGCIKDNGLGDVIKLDKCMQYLKRRLKEQGLYIYDITIDLGCSGWLRAEEIQEWLSKHDDITNIVILDDEEFNFKKAGLDKYWIETQWYYTHGGLNQEHVNKAINILNEVSYDTNDKRSDN